MISDSWLENCGYFWQKIWYNQWFRIANSWRTHHLYLEIYYSELMIDQSRRQALLTVIKTKFRRKDTSKEEFKQTQKQTSTNNVSRMLQIEFKVSPFIPVFFSKYDKSFWKNLKKYWQTEFSAIFQQILPFHSYFQAIVKGQPLEN